MNNKTLDKYKVVLYQYTKKEIKHVVEATDCDDAIKRVCELEGIKYNPKNQPSCMVQRTD
jgi:uncharacterized protein with GYD domain